MRGGAERAYLAGEAVEPLAGVPVAVKDLFDTAGVRTTYGSAIFAEHVPSEDATAVSRVRQAGGIVVGKTATHEFAWGITTDNPHFGPTRNPWRLERVAGGSAAALAALEVPLALGTDTGGSIRIPAALCGVIGLKPSFGRVSLAGVCLSARALARPCGADGADAHRRGATPLSDRGIRPARSGDRGGRRPPCPVSRTPASRASGSASQGVCPVASRRPIAGATSPRLSGRSPSSVPSPWMSTYNGALGVRDLCGHPTGGGALRAQTGAAVPGAGRSLRRRHPRPTAARVVMAGASPSPRTEPGSGASRKLRVLQTTWVGRRDHALLLLAIQTGLRASELIGLTCSDLHLGTGAHLSCHGKGRKDRVTPLTSGTVATLAAWLQERAGDPTSPLFPSSRGRPLSRDAIEHRLAKYLPIAARACPSLADKKVTMHVLRHTTAMRLLHAGVDTAVIALWLGHESVETTQIYLHADLALKERALAKTTPPTSAPGRYRPPDTTLAFLEAL